METIRLSQNELFGLQQLQVKPRGDWPAVFTANCRRDIWAYENWSYAPFKMRKELRGVSRILQRLVAKYRMERGQLGRFFVDSRGAFYKIEEKQEIQFVAFEIRGRS